MPARSQCRCSTAPSCPSCGSFEETHARPLEYLPVLPGAAFGCALAVAEPSPGRCQCVKDVCRAWNSLQAGRRPPKEAGAPPLQVGRPPVSAARLLVMVLSLALVGCTTDNIAWLKHRSRIILTDYRRVQHEHAAQRRTTDRLLAACRECLAAGGAEALCWGNLSAYRACLDAGGSDAECRTD